MTERTRAIPPFLLQLVDRDGVIVRTAAGGPQEAELVNLFVRSIMPKGVGFFKTEAQVEAAIRAGIVDALTGIKIRNPFDVTGTD